ncbi:FIG004453: protein YceG like [hydrothermal vent metagenome]|uniref:FIG004453: protein YceG like n=1 Tax=hydrothermal vent metagenome TaxID=652676 RepID=A0A3B0YTE2_9ZZZZ
MFKLLGILVLLGSFIGGWLMLDFQSFTKTPLLTEANTQRSIIIHPGTGLNELADALHQNKIIYQPAYFKLLARWQGYATKIQAGEYLVTTGMTAEDLLKKLVNGKVVQHAFTIIEGWTFKQLRIFLSENKNIIPTINTLTDAEIMTALGHEGEHPEGRFNPDTYHFPGGTTDLKFLARAFKETENYLEKAWEQRDKNLPLKTPYEALILASIVERETAVVNERAQIAGVFVRRLNKNMRLQTDPTVIYGMGDRYNGNITRADLKRDTPYNTYTRKGLPPTPIALASKQAIDAVLHPKDGKSLYFVAMGDGRHYFSSTLKEHNKAVREYQILKPRRERAAQRKSQEKSL